MGRPGKELMNHLEVVARVDLVGGQDTILAVDFEDGDRDHQVAGQLECVGLCERKVVRHFEDAPSGAGQFPLVGSSKGPRPVAITAKAKPGAAAAC